MNKLFFGDNLDYLPKIESNSIDLIYIDPPFNTGKTQSRTKIKTLRNQMGDRVGFGGNTYQTIGLSTTSYTDVFDNYLDFLRPRISELYRVLSQTGTFYLHLGIDEVHYVKILCDEILGRRNFCNEIIWAYDFGGRSNKNWYKKHDIILMYSKTKDYYFNLEECDTIPYITDGMVSEEKIERGKFPTNCWFISIEGTNSRNRVGYATEKPTQLLTRLLKVSSRVGDTVLDCFAGSGKIGKIANELDRNFILIDNNIDAVNIMRNKTLKGIDYTYNE